MANPRRSSYSNGTENSNPFHVQNLSIISSIKHFFKRPHAFPCLLSVFIFLTWLSLRLQHPSSSFKFPRTTHHSEPTNKDDDNNANLIRFKSSIFPSPIIKDKRGWILNPVSLALDSGITGGAVYCSSIHIGEIRPGAIRGNHRHYNCNETFVVWGAKTLFRVENEHIVDRGYAQVIIDADEVAIAASPRGTAHLLVNVDPLLSTYFIGCQDNMINYNGSTTDFNVWKDF